GVALLLFHVGAGRLLLQVAQRVLEFLTFRLVLIDFGLDLVDAAVHPLVRRLLVVEQLEDGVDGREVEAPEQGGDGGAGDGQDETAWVGPGVAHGAQEVLHGNTRSTGGRRGATRGPSSKRRRVVAQGGRAGQGHW